MAGLSEYNQELPQLLDCLRYQNRQECCKDFSQILRMKHLEYQKVLKCIGVSIVYGVGTANKGLF